MLVSLPELVGVSPAVARLRREVDDAARCDAKVLISGESGVGKEVVANLIHAGSARSAERLVAVNCAAMAETLLETELFGHVRGAFTDAYRDRVGMLELAHRGTVFLDEVGEMTPRMQGMLLRFLENGEVQRVGAEQAHRRVNVRLIAATNRNLTEAVAAGTFRSDLFYRLNIFPIVIPPLRERREDIPALLEEFLEGHAARTGGRAVRLSGAALTALCQHDWPGNVRELKNVIERVMARGATDTIQLADLPDDLGRRGVQPAQAAPAPRATADLLYDRIVVRHESFWEVVHAPFMARDLTRADLRALIGRGLSETGGSYRALVTLFGMPPDDYKRLLSFLRKYQCQLPLHQFRSRPSPAA